MTRLQNQEFWMTSKGNPTRAQNPGLIFNRVTLTTELDAFLTDQVNSPSRVRGGLLFGYSRDQTLHLLLASTAAISNWYPARVRTVADIDVRFALGWSEAVRSILGTPIDRVEHWSVPPDNRLGMVILDAPDTDLQVHFEALSGWGVLLILGFHQGVLSYLAVRMGREGAPEVLPLQVLPASLEDHWKLL